MARNEQLIRQHKIVQLLERNRFGLTLDEMRSSVVDELGLSSLHSRSIRRDIEALVAAGMPIIDEETGRGRVWKLSRADKGLHRLSITASELISLSMSRDLMIPLVGTQFWIGIESFWNKIREQLPEPVFEHYERYRRTLYVLGLPTKNYEKQKGIIKTVNRAIQEHRRLEIEYQVPGRMPSVRVLEPYGLVLFQSSIYVISTEESREGESTERLKHWKLDRFQSASALDNWFKPNLAIDVSSHLGQSVGIFSGGKPREYKIRLSQQAARWVEEDPWHANQKIEYKDDGSAQLSVTAYHNLEIIQRVLQFGAQAEILSPADCRKEIADTVKQMSRFY